MKRMNKRGQEMQIGTIIAIVLGIAVLVFLIFGFSQGWNNLWERVTLFGGGDNNVDTIVQACALKCSTGDKYGFCEEKMTVRLEFGLSVGSCHDLIDPVDFKKGDTLTPGIEVGVDSCPGISCN